MKVLVRRSIEKDGLPKEEGAYLFLKKDEYGESGRRHRGYKLEDREWFSNHYTYWIEEIELSKLLEEVMPTKQKIAEAIDEGNYTDKKLSLFNIQTATEAVWKLLNGSNQN